jgi:hypothetical protein
MRDVENKALVRNHNNQGILNTTFDPELPIIAETFDNKIYACIKLTPIEIYYDVILSLAF